MTRPDLVVFSSDAATSTAGDRVEPDEALVVGDVAQLPGSDDAPLPMTSDSVSVHVCCGTGSGVWISIGTRCLSLW